MYTEKVLPKLLRKTLNNFDNGQKRGGGGDQTGHLEKLWNSNHDLILF